MAVQNAINYSWIKKGAKEMREIKFRAWDKETKQMILMPLDTLFGLARFFGFIPINSVLMQYTGRKIKGVEAYEWDIIENQYGKTYLIDFRYGSWVAVHEPLCRAEMEGECKWDYLYDFIKTYDVEVVGNVYENPTLMEATK